MEKIYNKKINSLEIDEFIANIDNEIIKGEIKYNGILKESTDKVKKFLNEVLFENEGENPYFFFNLEIENLEIEIFYSLKETVTSWRTIQYTHIFETYYTINFKKQGDYFKIIHKLCKEMGDKTDSIKCRISINGKTYESYDKKELHINLVKLCLDYGIDLLNNNLLNKLVEPIKNIQFKPIPERKPEEQPIRYTGNFDKLTKVKGWWGDHHPTEQEIWKEKYGTYDHEPEFDR